MLVIYLGVLPIHVDLPPRVLTSMIFKPVFFFTLLLFSVLFSSSFSFLRFLVLFFFPSLY